jgi:hypothetical protein
MVVDLYTKAVLTTVAGCLIYLSAGQPAVPAVVAVAEAQAPAPAPPPPVPEVPGQSSPQQPKILPPQVQILPVPQTILSGGDIGFRVEGRRRGVVFGTWVVRIGGEWVSPETNGRIVPLSH